MTDQSYDGNGNGNADCKDQGGQSFYQEPQPLHTETDLLFHVLEQGGLAILVDLYWMLMKQMTEVPGKSVCSFFAVVLRGVRV
jgi:hypothetical protein